MKATKFLTVDEAATVLRTAAKFGLQPIVALGLFAGLRIVESLQVDWEDVRFKKGQIVIASGKHSKRLVPANDTLIAWLKNQNNTKGPIRGTSALRSRLRSLQRECGLSDFSFHSLRDTFAAYHLVSHANMRHPGLPSRLEAARYWALRPQQANPKPVATPIRPRRGARSKDR